MTTFYHCLNILQNPSIFGIHTATVSSVENPDICNFIFTIQIHVPPGGVFNKGGCTGAHVPIIVDVSINGIKWKCNYLGSAVR